MHKSLIAVLAASASLVAVAPASAAPTWAPAATAAVHPGVQTETDGAQCTSNFVFYDASTTISRGGAALWAAPGSNPDTEGCPPPSRPLGTPVTVDGASQP